MEAIMNHPGQTMPLLRSLFFLTLLAATVLPAPAAEAYEVWLTDQSDTGKESGGLLYIYDGAQLAANPSATKPTQTIDFSGEIGKFCEEATKKAVRRPHMLFFNANQDHALISFLSGQVLIMDAATKKPRFSFTPPLTNVPWQYSDLASRWQAQLGIRYSF